MPRIAYKPTGALDDDEDEEDEDDEEARLLQKAIADGETSGVDDTLLHTARKKLAKAQETGGTLMHDCVRVPLLRVRVRVLAE